jgi:aminopeptidase S
MLYLNLDMLASPNSGDFVQGGAGADADDAGVPSGGVLAGDEQAKSDEQAAAWGGRVDENFDRCYHSACDRIDDLDRTAMDRFTDAVAGALAHFATTNEPLDG